MRENALDSLAGYIATVKWVDSEVQECITPYFAANNISLCYADALSFIRNREKFIQSIPSTYNPLNYTIDECPDSPDVVPIYNAYSEVPGKPSNPIVTDLGNSTYEVDWWPANPNGNRVRLYEVYVQIDLNDPFMVYNDSSTVTEYNAPANANFVKFAVRAKNRKGYSPFSDYIGVPTLQSFFPNLGNVPKTKSTAVITGVAIVFGLFTLGGLVLGIFLTFSGDGGVEPVRL